MPICRDHQIEYHSTPKDGFESRPFFILRVVDKGSIGALTLGQDLYIRVDSFNESGITEGSVQRITK